MLVEYLWGILQAHQVMEYFVWTQFRQHPEVSAHITLYLFEHRDQITEVQAVRQNMGAQSKLVAHLEKTVN